MRPTIKHDRRLTEWHGSILRNVGTPWANGKTVARFLGRLARFGFGALTKVGCFLYLECLASGRHQLPPFLHRYSAHRQRVEANDDALTKFASC